MSILTVGPSEIARRKTVSDFKSSTDNLTFADSRINSSHGEAAQSVRARKDSLAIKALETQTVDDYYNEFELEELYDAEQVHINNG